MKSPRRILAALALAMSLTAMIGACSSDDSSSADGEVVGTVDRGPTTEVRKSGDELRVVALGWSDGEIALSLGVAPIAVYDWQSFGEEAKGVSPWATEAFGDVSPTVIANTGTGYNYEQIELLEPDLILNVRAAEDQKIFDRLAEIAPVASAPEGTPDYAINWRTHTEIIGKAIGKSAEAEAAIEETNAVIAEAAAANPDFAGKTFVWGSKFGDAYGASVTGDTRFDVFAELGFVEFPPVLPLQSSGFFVNVAAEQVSALDSQVAVLTTIFLPLTDLTSDPLINSLSVYQDGRAIVLDEKDNIVVALSTGTPESIALAVEAVVPQLQEAVAKVA